MELRHLRYFVAVAEDLHFGRAAERLGMAQPPLSQQIKALETELGVALFDRNRRKVELTEAGKALLSEARAILDQAAGLGGLARRVAAGQGGRLEIAFTGSVPFNQIMPRALGNYRRAYPGVWMSLREMSTGSQIQGILEGWLDVGFARPADDNLPPGIAWRRVLREALVVAIPADHPLAGRCRDGLSMSELADHDMVINPRHIGTGLYDRVESLCLRAGFRPKVVAEAHQMSTALGLVGAGMGVAVMPLTMQRLGFEGVVFAHILDDQAFIDLLLIHRRAQSSAAVDNFLAVVDMLADDSQ